MAAAPSIVPRERVYTGAALAAKSEYARWSAAEDSVIRERAEIGTAAIQELLPHRSRDSIRQHARTLGCRIRWVKGKGHKRLAQRAVKSPGLQTHPLVLAVFEEIAHKQMTWDEAEKKAGLGIGAIRGWRESMPRVHNLQAALNVLGLDLAVVKRVKGQANYL